MDGPSPRSAKHDDQGIGIDPVLARRREPGIGSHAQSHDDQQKGPAAASAAGGSFAISARALGLRGALSRHVIAAAAGVHEHLVEAEKDDGGGEDQGQVEPHPAGRPINQCGFGLLHTVFAPACRGCYRDARRHQAASATPDMLPHGAGAIGDAVHDRASARARGPDGRMPKE